MTRKGRAAIGLLVILFTIVVFFIGIRIGKKIEQIDKKYEVAQKNAKKSALQTDPFFTYTGFYSPYCGIRFLHPQALKEKEEATDEAAVIYEGRMIAVQCTREIMRDFNRIKKPTMTGEGTMIASVEATLYRFPDKNTYQIYIIHPKTERDILITISKELLPLFEQTLEFVE